MSDIWHSRMQLLHRRRQLALQIDFFTLSIMCHQNPEHVLPCCNWSIRSSLKLVAMSHYLWRNKSKSFQSKQSKRWSIKKQEKEGRTLTDNVRQVCLLFCCVSAHKKERQFQYYRPFLAASVPQFCWLFTKKQQNMCLRVVYFLEESVTQYSV